MLNINSGKENFIVVTNPEYLLLIRHKHHTTIINANHSGPT